MDPHVPAKQRKCKRGHYTKNYPDGVPFRSDRRRRTAILPHYVISKLEGNGIFALQPLFRILRTHAHTNGQTNTIEIIHT
jgi:hypothetical protein